ncbi:DUF1636 domain-containing protein [Stappia sp. ES.058]|uniref:DUF1636 family protein n=1 Tax=Stappia sp. ES.058 TaxID=1881061 RepID=UPI00087D50D7|nr:DUF1636 domain-containing protein [Stappia sp. ES.058]SDU03750.1 Predicted metal-binding protein [Stappia sp. ES.058]
MIGNPNFRTDGTSRRQAAGRTHRITVCTSCGGGPEDARREGNRLLAGLADALKADGCAPYEVAGVRCMAGCKRPCTVAFQATDKASYLFGEIDPDTDIPPLVAFAAQYARLDDGWCSQGSRPAGLIGKTLARIPALPAPLTPDRPNLSSDRPNEDPAR